MSIGFESENIVDISENSHRESKNSTENLYRRSNNYPSLFFKVAFYRREICDPTNHNE